MLQYIVKFFKALNSNSKPSEIANAFCIGILLGFLPKTNLLWYLIFVFFSFIRINKSFYFITILIVSQISFLLDGLFNSIGFSVLNYAPLENIFSFLIDIPFVGFTKFNNTIVMGSFVFSLLIYIPCFFLGIGFVLLWRKYIGTFLARSPILKTFCKLPLINKISSIVKKI